MIPPRAAYFLILAALPCQTVVAAIGSAVYLPLTFRSESGPFKTGACLQVNERAYSQATSQQGLGVAADGSQKAFETVLTALKSANRQTLFELSDPVLGRDPAQFDEQAVGYFKEFKAAEFVGVAKIFEFDRLAVFFGKFQAGEYTFFSPFIFHRGNDGAFGFLPYRTDDLTYWLLEDWLDAAWGPAQAAVPAYCTAADISVASHRLRLSPPDMARPAYLYLKGAPADTQGPLKALSAQVRLTLVEMKKTLAADDWITGFCRYLAPAGAKRLKDWFASAAQGNREIYRNAIAEQEPFFVFDAAPLIIVYTRSPSHSVQVMYFTSAADGRLMWTNSSLVTLLDRVFKGEAMKDAAMLDKPFSSLEIK